MNKNNITPKRFDDAMTADAGPEKVADAIWGAKAIGKSINRSADYVRDTLASMPGSPVRRMGREYYAIASELREFMRPAHSTP